MMMVMRIAETPPPPPQPRRKTATFELIERKRVLSAVVKCRLKAALPAPGRRPLRVSGGGGGTEGKSICLRNGSERA